MPLHLRLGLSQEDRVTADRLQSLCAYRVSNPPQLAGMSADLPLNSSAQPSGQQRPGARLKLRSSRLR